MNVQWSIAKLSDIVSLLYIKIHEVWFDRHVVRLTYIDINMDIVYL